MTLNIVTAGDAKEKKVKSHIFTLLTFRFLRRAVKQKYKRKVKTFPWCEK